MRFLLCLTLLLSAPGAASAEEDAILLRPARP